LLILLTNAFRAYAADCRENAATSSLGLDGAACGENGVDAPGVAELRLCRRFILAA